MGQYPLGGYNPMLGVIWVNIIPFMGLHWVNVIPFMGLYWVHIIPFMGFYWVNIILGAYMRFFTVMHLIPTSISFQKIYTFASVK